MPNVSRRFWTEARRCPIRSSPYSPDVARDSFRGLCRGRTPSSSMAKEFETKRFALCRREKWVGRTSLPDDDANKLAALTCWNETPRRKHGRKVNQARSEGAASFEIDGRFPTGGFRAPIRDRGHSRISRVGDCKQPVPDPWVVARTKCPDRRRSPSFSRIARPPSSFRPDGTTIPSRAQQFLLNPPNFRSGAMRYRMAVLAPLNQYRTYVAFSN